MDTFHDHPDHNHVDGNTPSSNKTIPTSLETPFLPTENNITIRVNMQMESYLKYEELGANGEWTPWTAVSENTNYNSEIDSPFKNLKLTTMRLKEECAARLQETDDAIKMVQVWNQFHDDPKAWRPTDVSFSWDTNGKLTISGADLELGLDGCYLDALDFSNLENNRFFSGFSLRHVTARHANFAGLVMKLCSLNNSQLHCARFEKCHLREADLSSTILFGAHFEDANLDYASLEMAGFVGNPFFTTLKRNLAGAPDKSQISDTDTDVYDVVDRSMWKTYRASIKFSSSQMDAHADQISFLLAELARLRQVEIDPENWDEYYDAWASLDQLYDTFTNKLCLKTIETLFSSDKISEQDVTPRLALGMAKALYRIRGKPPRGLVLMLKMQVARILRQPAYFQIVCDLNAETHKYWN